MTLRPMILGSVSVAALMAFAAPAIAQTDPAPQAAPTESTDQQSQDEIVAIGIQVTNRTGGEASAISVRGLPAMTTTWNGRSVFTAPGRHAFD